MNSGPNTFRLWLTAALLVAWSVLLVRFVVLSNWPLAGLSAILLLMYGYRLYNLLKGK